MRRAAVLALALLAGCPKDEDCSQWANLHDADDGVLLSIQGRSIDDAWLAGGGLHLGFATLRHFDGVGWTAVEIDDDRTLWWVTPDGISRAWAVGERGAIVHVVGETVERFDVETEATFFGAWAVAADDVWVVGGIPDGEATADDDYVLHWDGAAFTRVEVPVRGAALFKVWGDAEGDLWVSGQHGTMLRWDGHQWSDHSSRLDTNVSILTVHGCATGEVYAVGGNQLWERTDEWRPKYEFASVVNGVHCSTIGPLVVGNGGLRIRIIEGSVYDESRESTWDTDYHSVWDAPDGGIFAAGGNFNSPTPPVRRGVLEHWSCPHPDGF